LPDLFGAARFRSGAILRRNGVRIDQLLREGRPAQGERYNKTHPPK
jgi:hypothetical protein